MYLFLDTEWADAEGNDLVSLALVSEDGAHRFYAERKPLPSAPTDFARLTVFPLLNRGHFALSDPVFTTCLRAFLANTPDAFVLFDYSNDARLLQIAMRGFGLLEGQVAAAFREPSLTLMIREGAFADYFNDWFAVNPRNGARRHHAAADAEALRMAFLRVTGRVSSSEWHRYAMQDPIEPPLPDPSCAAHPSSRPVD